MKTINKARILSISTLLIMISLLGFTVPDVSSEDEGSTRAYEYPYCSFNAYNLFTTNIGDQTSFYMRVYNNYDGSEYQGTSYVSGQGSLHDAKLSIYYDLVTDVDDNPVSVIEPTGNGLSVYNGAGAAGFTISFSQYYYGSESGDYFQFSAKLIGAKAGTYKLPMKLNAKIIKDYDPGTDTTTWEPITENGFAYFTIASNMGGVDPKGTTLRGYEAYSYQNIYSGARYLSLILPNIWATDGPLTSFKATLTLEQPDFYVHTPTLKIDELRYTRSLTWKINVAPDADPGEHTGTITFKYEKEEVEIIEGDFDAVVTVAATPLLVGSDTEGMTIPTVEITQKSGSKEFSMAFRNEGNVPIISATLSLDLDSSRFMRQQEFYYNENDQASKVYPPLEFTAEDIPIGEGFIATFPEIGVSEMLPPGDYLIPIDYKITYTDPFDDTGAGIRLYSYQWDEIGQEDYMDIMWFKSDPRPTELLQPHIMVRVFDDRDGMDITAECRSTLGSGDRNVYMEIEVTNKELYPLSDASVTVISENPDILSTAGSDGGADPLYSQSGVNLEGSSNGHVGTYSAGMRVDIAPMTPSGPQKVYMIITGYNDHLEKVTINVTVPVNIKADPARIEVASISTTDVKPGSDFVLKVTVYNSGDVTIDEFELMLSCTDNMVNVELPVRLGGSLAPGEQATITYDCRANDCMDYGESCQMDVMASFTDRENNIQEFSQGDSIPINVMSAREPQDQKINSAIENIGYYFMIALILFALIIGLCAILSVFIFVKVGRSTPVEKRTEVKKEKAEPTKETSHIGGTTLEELEKDLSIAPSPERVDQGSVAPPLPGPSTQTTPAQGAAPELPGAPPLPSQTPVGQGPVQTPQPNPSTAPTPGTPANSTPNEPSKIDDLF